MTAPRILILGGGAATEHLHLPALQRLDWLANTSVADLNPRALEHLQPQFSAIKTKCIGFAEALASEPPDFAVITLPNHLHEAACLAALEARVPVLCEKPLVLNSETCLRLHDAFGRALVPLAVGMSRRFSAAFRAMRTALSEGVIGTIQSVRVSHGGLYEWPSTSGEAFRTANGGVLADMGVHFLDLLQLILGKLEAVEYTDDWAGGVEAECQIRLRSDSGIPASLRLSRRQMLPNEFVVEGSRGSLTMHAANFANCTLRIGSEVKGTIGLGTDADFIDAFVEQYRQWWPGFGSTNSQLSNAQQHAEVIALVEQSYAQHHQPQRISSPGLQGRMAITGATGFIGTRLVERMGEFDDVTLRCLVRSYRRAAGIGRYPVEMVRAGIGSLDELISQFADCRFVVHLAFGNDGEIADQKRTTIEGTQNVVEAAIDAGVETVVILSTLWVYGFPATDQVLDESAPYQPHGGAYAESKAVMERWCLERAKTSGRTRIVILNPGNVYGPWSYAYTRLPLDLAARGAFAWVDGGEGICHYNHVDNLVDAILAACTTVEAHGQRFIMADGHCTWREFLTPLLGDSAATIPCMSKAELSAQEPPPGTLRDVLRAALSSPELRRAAGSVPLIRKLRSLAQKTLPARAIAPATPKAQTSPSVIEAPQVPSWLAQLYPSSTTRFSAAKAERLLHWKPRVSLKQGQAAAREWWLAASSNQS